MPSSSASASTALGGTEKCCQTPAKSANPQSIIWPFLSLIVLRPSWAVAQLRAMSSLPRLKAVALDDCCSADQPPPSSPVRTSVWSRPRRRRQAGRFNGHAASDAPISKACRLWPRLSGFVRPAHQLEGRFDVPPSFGVFAFALLFQGTSLLRGLGNGLVAVCFQQLPRVVVDFAFLHSHGVMLLFFSARLSAPIARARRVDVDTYQDLQAHLSTSRRQESAHAMVQPVRGECATRRHVLYGHGVAVCPLERPAPTLSPPTLSLSFHSHYHPH